MPIMRAPAFQYTATRCYVYLHDVCASSFGANCIATDALCLHASLQREGEQVAFGDAATFMSVKFTGAGYAVRITQNILPVT